jgi:hypothetical protein
MIEVIRNPRRKKRPSRWFWVNKAATIALLFLALSGCTTLESLCWTANANKTCPSILNVAE